MRTVKTHLTGDTCDRWPDFRYLEPIPYPMARVMREHDPYGDGRILPDREFPRITKVVPMGHRTEKRLDLEVSLAQKRDRSQLTFDVSVWAIPRPGITEATEARCLLCGLTASMELPTQEIADWATQRLVDLTRMGGA